MPKLSLLEILSTPNVSLIEIGIEKRLTSKRDGTKRNGAKWRRRVIDRMKSVHCVGFFLSISVSTEKSTIYFHIGMKSQLALALSITLSSPVLSHRMIEIVCTIRIRNDCANKQPSINITMH